MSRFWHEKKPLGVSGNRLIIPSELHQEEMSYTNYITSFGRTSGYMIKFQSLYQLYVCVCEDLIVNKDESKGDRVLSSFAEYNLLVSNSSCEDSLFESSA